MVDKENKKYVCRWCGNKFEQMVGTSDGGKHSTVTDQVKCPKCGNFINS